MTVLPFGSDELVPISERTINITVDDVDPERLELSKIDVVEFTLVDEVSVSDGYNVDEGSDAGGPVVEVETSEDVDVPSLFQLEMRLRR